MVNRELAATAAEAPRAVSTRAELWAALEREEDDEAWADAALREAAEQLRRYLADERLARQYPSVRFTGLALVFRGWELARCEAVPFA